MAEFSKKFIRKTGKKLASGALQAEERQAALAVVGYWRTAHLEPLNKTVETIEGLCQNDKSTILVSRLKRIETIVEKLGRVGQQGNLDTLRDIAGCRLIVNSIDEVIAYADLLRSTEIYHQTIDYLTTPKQSGYRGLHIVCRCDAPVFDYSEIDVEVQIRTRQQHVWATAVEAYDVISNAGVKIGAASDIEANYFKLASDLMYADNAKKQILVEELGALERELRILDRLEEAMSSIYVVENDVQDITRSDCCLITLQPDVQQIELEVFNREQETEATKRYTELESEAEDGYIYLLARASSFEQLKLAYPNYYFNISEFVSWLSREIGQ